MSGFRFFGKKEKKEKVKSKVLLLFFSLSYFLIATLGLHILTTRDENVRKF